MSASAWAEAALLTTDQMARADQAAIAGGCPGYALMQAAGAGIVRVLVERFSPRPVIVLCGPGNNGGDGYVVARLLRRRGWPVRVAALGDPGRLGGDAAIAHADWGGPVLPLGPQALEGAELAVDALFGAGLARDVAGCAAATLRAAGARALPLIAVDVPSGLDGNTGQVRGTCLPAVATVTFFRFKPGHLLLPGRALCGALHLVDIGIPDTVLASIGPKVARNHPDLWRSLLPQPGQAGHKYSRGHLLARAGGPTATGAARLGAQAALHAGAGLVTLVARRDAARAAAAQSTAVMVAIAEDDAAFEDLLADPRRNALLIGPGNGVDPATRAAVLAALCHGRDCVLDADALTVFADRPEALFEALHPGCVLTPHDGEFRRIFSDLADLDDKVEKVRRAASRCNAVVLLKGADTVIAEPGGLALVNANAPPVLATAGSGDVLAGLVAGLRCGGMPAFAAAAAGTWLHGAAGTLAGRGATAESLLPRIPAAWSMSACDSVPGLV